MHKLEVVIKTHLHFIDGRRCRHEKLRPIVAPYVELDHVTFQQDMQEHLWTEGSFLSSTGCRVHQTFHVSNTSGIFSIGMLTAASSSPEQPPTSTSFAGRTSQASTEFLFLSKACG